MFYSSIVENRIRRTFDHVNNHRWDEALEAVAPHVHHRVSGTHALGGERHDKDAMRRWFERFGRVLPNLQITVDSIAWPSMLTTIPGSSPTSAFGHAALALAALPPAPAELPSCPTFDPPLAAAPAEAPPTEPAPLEEPPTEPSRAPFAFEAPPVAEGPGTAV